MPRPIDPRTPLSDLADDQVRSTLNEQRRLLESLRDRSGTLLTGSTVSTSFLGSQALARGSLGLLSWLAIGCFVVVGLASLAILWPRRRAELAAKPSLAPDPLVALRFDEEVASQKLALLRHRRASVGHNEAYLARIATYLRVGVTFLAFEVLWWVADLATST